jgi:hypothetical protein
MSHIAIVAVEYKDLIALRSACEHLGLDFHEGRTQHRFYRGQMSNCLHAISLPVSHPKHARAYEVGVVAHPEKEGVYQLALDNYNNGDGLCDVVGRNCVKLRTAYKRSVAIGQMKRQGLKLQKELQVEGTTKTKLIFARA